MSKVYLFLSFLFPLSTERQAKVLFFQTSQNSFAVFFDYLRSDNMWPRDKSQRFFHFIRPPVLGCKATSPFMSWLAAPFVLFQRIFTNCPLQSIFINYTLQMIFANGPLPRVFANWLFIRFVFLGHKSRCWHVPSFNQSAASIFKLLR